MGRASSGLGLTNDSGRYDRQVASETRTIVCRGRESALEQGWRAGRSILISETRLEFVRHFFCVVVVFLDFEAGRGSGLGLQDGPTDIGNDRIGFLQGSYR